MFHISDQRLPSVTGGLERSDPSEEVLEEDYFSEGARYLNPEPPRRVDSTIFVDG